MQGDCLSEPSGRKNSAIVAMNCLGRTSRRSFRERVAERLIDDGLPSSLAFRIGTETETGRAQGWRRISDRDHAKPARSAEENSGDPQISALAQTNGTAEEDEFVQRRRSWSCARPLTSISRFARPAHRDGGPANCPSPAARLLTIAHTNSQRLVCSTIFSTSRNSDQARRIQSEQRCAVRSLVEHAIEDNPRFCQQLWRAGPARCRIGRR